MMELYYSPSQGTWYSPLISGTRITFDMKPVPDAIYQQLCSAAAAGAPTSVLVGGVSISGNPAAGMSLGQAQGRAFLFLDAAYQLAVATPVTFTTAAGVTKAFQADPGSQANMQATLVACQHAGAVPTGFAWVAADNTQVPMTYADVQGLAAAVFAQALTAFVRLQAAKGAVRAATVPAAALAVTW